MPIPLPDWTHPRQVANPASRVGMDSVNLAGVLRVISLWLPEHIESPSRVLPVRAELARGKLLAELTAI